MTETTVKEVPAKVKVVEQTEAERVREEVTEKRLAYAEVLKGKEVPVENPVYGYYDNAGISVPVNFSQEPVDLNGRPFRKNENDEFVDDDGKALTRKEQKVAVDPVMEELQKSKADIRAAFGELHIKLAGLLDGRENDDIKRAYETLDQAMGWFTR